MALSLLASAVALGGCSVIVDARADQREEAAVEDFPPEGQFIEVDGRRVHAVVTGDGPDLVLIHGAGGNTRDFTQGFVDRVSDRYRVTVFDRPGFGYTDRVSDAFGGPFNTRAESPQQQAAFLAAAADKLGVERPIVLGHSYGGAVALAWGLDHDAAGLVIVSGVSNPWPGGLGPLYRVGSSALGGAALVPVLTAFAPEDRIDLTIDLIFAPQDPPEGYADDIGAPLSLRRESFRANVRQVNSLRPNVVEMSARYDEIDIPVEIIHGTADQIVPADIHAAPLVDQIDGAFLTVLDGIGHMPHHVAPIPVVEAVDRAAARAGLR